MVQIAAPVVRFTGLGALDEHEARVALPGTDLRFEKEEAA